MSNPYESPSLSQETGVPSETSAAITQGVLDQLRRTKPWVRFISVLMFIGAGFMMLIGVVMGVMGGFGAMAAPEGVAFGLGFGVVMALIYGALALLYIYPAMKLWKYASRIAVLLDSGHPVELEAALNEQRKFWKFMGVVTIVVMVLYLVAIIVAVVLGATGMMNAAG